MIAPEQSGPPVDPTPAATVLPRRTLDDTGRATIVGGQILLTVAVLAFWQLASGRLVPSFFISSPVEVAHKLVAWIADGTIFLHLWVTFEETVLGFLVGSLAGIILGVALGVSRFLSRLLTPFVAAFNALPKPALAPLFVLWFGLGIGSKVVLSAVIVFFIVFFNTFTGVREADRDLIDTLRLMRASRRYILTHAILPSAATWIFTGLQIAVPYALIGAIVGELIAAKAGLGYLIQAAGASFDTAAIFASLVVIVILAIVLNVAVEALRARLQRWKVTAR